MQNMGEFFAKWQSTLESGALVKFASAPLGELTGNHCQIADGFVTAHGLKPIGFNWELLDASAPEGAPRSGIGELVGALSHSLANPSKAWLTQAKAAECAQEFLGLFDPVSVTLVSNRYEGLWNPVAGGAVEWGFVAFDHKHIALLLLASST